MSEITTTKHLIDFDVDPFIPDGWSILPDKEQLPNRFRGRFRWNPDAVELYLSKYQEIGKRIEGNSLREELKNKPVFNANLLDYLFKYPDLIPEKWEGKTVFFWGTIYHGQFGHLSIRGLNWSDDGLHFGSQWIDDDWYDDYPAAFAS